MAATKISDIVIPEIFVPYVQERTRTQSALFTSGIISPSPILDALASRGGRLINMPFFKDLAGNSEVLSDLAELTPQKITTDTDIAVLLMRGKAWGSNDLADALAGDDPLQAIVNLVGDWWARDMQTTLINLLTGVFEDNIDNDFHDLVHDITTADPIGSVVTTDDFNATSFQAAIQLLGDAKAQLAAIAVHSQIESNMRIADLIEDKEDSVSGLPIPYYAGKRVIVDDNCPVEAGTSSGYNYTNYIFTQGAIGYGDGAAPTPVETDRNKLLGEDYLIHRKHFILHPMGVKFDDGSVAGESPTNAELALAANWDRVYEKKNIGIVKFVTNG
jgi:hypothetical protein